jgi:hypothetical protein
MRARAIMILGTSSHVGRSLLTAALCHIFALRALSGCSVQVARYVVGTLPPPSKAWRSAEFRPCRQKPRSCGLGPDESHPHQAVRRVILTGRRAGSNPRHSAVTDTENMRDGRLLLAL